MLIRAIYVFLLAPSHHRVDVSCNDRDYVGVLRISVDPDLSVRVSISVEERYYIFV